MHSTQIPTHTSDSNIFAKLLIYIEINEIFESIQGVTRSNFCYGGVPIFLQLVIAQYLAAQPKMHSPLNRSEDNQQPNKQHDPLNALSILANWDEDLASLSSSEKEEIDQFLVAIDLSQTRILSQEALFNLQRDNVQLDQNTIDALMLQPPQGKCGGLSSLFLPCIWLQTQMQSANTSDNNNYKEQDNLDWFAAMVIRITNWDSNYTTLALHEKKGFERFFSFVHHYQANLMLLEGAQQGDLDKLFFDTLKRTPKREYSLAGLFTYQDLIRDYTCKMDDGKEVTAPLFDFLAPERRLVYIRSHNHAVALFRFQSQFYYLDPNHRFSVLVFKENRFADLAKILFANMQFDVNTPSPLGFKVFSFDPESAYYPYQSELLTEHAFASGYANNFTALMMAAAINCDHSFFFHLFSPYVDVNAQNHEGLTALHLAAFYNDVEKTGLLIAKGADVNLRNAIATEYRTPLHYAALHNNEEIVKLLLENGANIEAMDINGNLPEDLTTSASIKVVISAHWEHKLTESLHEFEKFLEALPKTPEGFLDFSIIDPSADENSLSKPQERETAASTSENEIGAERLFHTKFSYVAELENQSTSLTFGTGFEMTTSEADLNEYPELEVEKLPFASKKEVEEVEEVAIIAKEGEGNDQETDIDNAPNLNRDYYHLKENLFKNRKHTFGEENDNKSNAHKRHRPQQQ